MMPPFDQLQFGTTLDIAARSSAGPNPENQDNFLLIDASGNAQFLDGEQLRQQQVPGWPAGHGRVAVLDGMGGHGHGRQAAEAVVAGLLALPACMTLAQLSSALDELHARLQAQFGDDTDRDMRPGTTLTMLELRPGQAALLYHVGDSRLYEIGAGEASPLTIDHVPATTYAMQGLIDEGEWWRQVHFEYRSQISQAFILGNAFSNPGELSDELCALSPLNLPPFLYHLPDRRVLELDPAAVYVLATDGFWACGAPDSWVARWPQLFEGKRNAAEMCDALFDEMQLRPPPVLHPDNLSAIVLRSRLADETALPTDIKIV
ncbi:MAG: protein phosphatase 2C domain-containing protein [Pseudomonadota bacterium]